LPARTRSVPVFRAAKEKKSTGKERRYAFVQNISAPHGLYQYTK